MLNIFDSLALSLKIDNFGVTYRQGCLTFIHHNNDASNVTYLMIKNTETPLKYANITICDQHDINGWCTYILATIISRCSIHKGV